MPATITARKRPAISTRAITDICTITCTMVIPAPVEVATATTRTITAALWSRRLRRMSATIMAHRLPPTRTPATVRARLQVEPRSTITALPAAKRSRITVRTTPLTTRRCTAGCTTRIRQDTSTAAIPQR